MSPACTDSNRNHEHRSIPRGKDTRQRTFTRPWLVANYCMGQCDVAAVGSRSGLTHISWWVHWKVEDAFAFEGLLVRLAMDRLPSGRLRSMAAWEVASR